MGQHGVKDLPLQLHAVALHHEQVIFDVLPHPGEVPAVKQRSKLRQYPFCPGPVCRQGDIITLSGDPAETQPHQFRPVRIYARGLRIKGDLLLLHQLPQEVTDLGVRLRHMIGVRGVADILLRPEAQFVRDFLYCGLRRCHGLLLPGRLHGVAEQIGLHTHRRRFKGIELLPQDALAQGPELQFGEYFFQRFLVHLLHAEILLVELHRRVDVNGRQFLAHDGQLPAVPHLLSKSALDVVCIGDHIFQGSEFRQQLGRRLLAHTGDAGDIVHRITHQSQYIDDLAHLLYPPFGADLCRPEDLEITALVGRLVYLDAVADQLSVILVRCDHVHVVAGLLRLLGQCPDHVIGLKAMGLNDGDVQSGDDAPDIRERGEQVFGGLLAVGLIVRKIGMPFRGLLRIETHGHMRGPLLVQQVDQRIGEAELGIRILALAGDARVPDQRVVGTEDQREGVQQKKLFLHQVLLSGSVI